MRQHGGQLHDMRSAGSLEDRLGSDLVDDESDRIVSAPGELIWLEPVRPFAIAIQPMAGPTPIRYFLDGVQKTLPGYHSSAVPIMASVTASAILERRSPSDLRILPGMLALNRAWLAPSQSELAGINAFIESAGASGVDIVDPLGQFQGEDYRLRLGNYAGVEQAALAASRNLRRQGETELLGRWTDARPDDGSWLVVDGTLRRPSPSTIGLVKSFDRQYVYGEQADQLFRLPAGHRSPSFVVADRRHGSEYAVWYIRLWDAQGRDPRYALIRVEVAQPDISPAEVDRLSAWLLAERRPRATADARWPTLLYPIHYLECILKNYLARETRSWPGVRGAA